MQILPCMARSEVVILQKKVVISFYDMYSSISIEFVNLKKRRLILLKDQFRTQFPEPRHFFFWIEVTDCFG